MLKIARVLLLIISLKEHLALVSAQLTDPTWRARKLISEMTLEEKITMLHGSGRYTGYTGMVPSNDRLGIPPILMNDAGNGFRDDDHPGTTTCFPSALAAGATWDPNLVQRLGEMMGEEFFNKGSNVMLGPGVNVARVPLNGRNFEYMSGGDPFLGYKMVQPFVKGVQSKHVVATVKHYVLNNQEIDRSLASMNSDERSMFELYYPPFLGAVEAGVGSFMCSYNKIHEVYACENEKTLNIDLKNRMKFDGWVMSDWGGTHSTSIRKGLDQEMPDGVFMGDTLLQMVQNGTIPEHVVDESVRRILTPMLRWGLFDYVVNPNNITNNVKTDEHTQFSRQLSAASHILLKNDGNILPLQANQPMKIALFGQAATQPIVAGGGSGAVYPSGTVSPYKGIANALGIDVQDFISTSCDGDYKEGIFYAQYGCESAPAANVDECCQFCSSYSNCNYFTFHGGRCNMYPTNGEPRPAVEKSGWEGAISGECKKTPPSSDWKCNSNNVCIAVIDGKNLDASKALAADADIAIVALATFGKEGSDREDLSYEAVKSDSYCQLTPTGQDNLVNVIAGTGTPVIVAAVSPAAVLMPWHHDVHSILFSCGFPGEEYGNALADIIFGSVNPTARLPLTIPNTENEVGFTPSEYPGQLKQVHYAEKLLVDYRWYIAHSVTPAFPFGHGLSYTSFEYDGYGCKASWADEEVSVECSLVVKNTGSLPGSDVAQLYVGLPAAAGEPFHQLKGFQKTALLDPGSYESLVFNVSQRSLSIWNSDKNDWELVSGTYTFKLGASSADIRFSQDLTIVQ